MLPSDLRYTKDHEWIRISGPEGHVGITDYAQKQLGDVVFVDLPAVGKKVKQGEPFGSIESVKAVSELFSPVSGEITSVNADLASRPETVNAHPYNTWMIAVRLSNPAEVDLLLDAAQYGALVT